MKIPFVSGLFLLVCLCLIHSTAFSQADKANRPSPLKEVVGTYQGANITITYSAPSVKGRTVWGDLVPYGKVWRTGANEATTFETDKDLTLDDNQILPAGKYALFTIPGEKEWTWVFNSVADQWGAFRYDAAQDVLRIVSSAGPSPVFHEVMEFVIAEEKITLYWENKMVSF